MLVGMNPGDLDASMFLWAMLVGMDPRDLDASMFRWAMLVGMDPKDLDASMCLRVVLIQPVWRFGGVNVPPGRGQGQGPRGFHTPYSPGRAWMQGPGRSGHVNVGGVGGLGGPADRVQSVTVPNTN